MRIDNILLDSLTEQAKDSPRLRMNFDLRNSAADTFACRTVMYSVS